MHIVDVPVARSNDERSADDSFMMMVLLFVLFLLVSFGSLWENRLTREKQAKKSKQHINGCEIKLLIKS